jgi:hypothetical protein
VKFAVKFAVIMYRTEDDAADDDEPEETEDAMVGKNGPIYLYLPVNTKFVTRLVVLEGSLLTLTNEEGNDRQTMTTKGAIIDLDPAERTQLKGVRRASAATMNIHPACHTFRIVGVSHEKGSHPDPPTKREWLLACNSSWLAKGWVQKFVAAGASTKGASTKQDSENAIQKRFTLADQLFTVVPIGGSGVGKSTLCNILSGSMWLTQSGHCIGYEDPLFKISGSTKSQTKAKDATMLLREWCGSADTVFKVMDTPGLIDSEGNDADSANIEAIVAKLKEEKRVHCFLLVIKTGRFCAEQGQIIAVLDKMLSSANAGSFLQHTIVLINQVPFKFFSTKGRANIPVIKKENIDEIRDCLRGQKDPNNKLYEDDSLFEQLQARTVLIPIFDQKVTFAQCQKACREILKLSTAMKEPFDCSDVTEAETMAMEISNMAELLEQKNAEMQQKDAEMQQKDVEMQQALADGAKKDAQIHDLQHKIAEVKKREEELDAKTEAVKKLIAEAEEKGADTSLLEVEKESLDAKKGELAAEREELRREYDEHAKAKGQLARRDAVLERIEVAVAVVELIPLPGIDIVCAVCRKLIDTLRALTAVAEDILSMTALIADVMDYMQRLRSILPQLEQQQRDQFKQKLQVNPLYLI